MTEIFYKYDPAESLDSKEAMEAFMVDAFETGDSVYIAKALGVLVKAKGMSQIAKETGLSREQLYRSFSEQGNPTLKTLVTVMKALDLTITVKHTT